MANPYREIFGIKGSLAFSFAGIVARFPIAMITISIVVMISAYSNSFLLPSFVATTFIAAIALISPNISRLADKYGQRKIGLPASFISALSLMLIVIAAHFHWPDYILFIAAIMAGAMPSFGSFSRARWSHVLAGKPILRSAFAFESLVDEMIFMIGPILVMNLATFFFPEAGMIAAIIILLIGSVWFCLQTKTEPNVIKINNKHNHAAIFDLPVLIIALTLSAIGGIFGVIEVTTIAYTKVVHLEKFAYLPLTAYASGSFITGILYGLLKIMIPLRKQLLFMSALIVITALPFFFVTNLWVLTLMCFVAGAACSPTIIICMSLLESLCNKQKFTESMTWAITGMTLGAAIGMAIAGLLIDHYGPLNAFRFCLIFALFSFTIAIIFRRKLITKTSMRKIKEV